MADGDMSTEATLPLEEVLYQILLSANEPVKEASLPRPDGMSSRDYGLILHAVTERLSFEGITIARKRGLVYRTDVRQTVRRVQSFTGTFMRKGERIVRMAMNAAAQADDPLDHERLEAAALRRQNRILDTKSKVQVAIKQRPKGV